MGDVASFFALLRDLVDGVNLHVDRGRSLAEPLQERDGSARARRVTSQGTSEKPRPTCVSEDVVDGVDLRIVTRRGVSTRRPHW
jgi:hypothetical protein